MKNIILIVLIASLVGAGSVIVIQHFSKSADANAEAEYVKKVDEATNAAARFTHGN